MIFLLLKYKDVLNFDSDDKCRSQFYIDKFFLYLNKIPTF